MKFLTWLGIGALLLAGGFVGGTAIVASNDKATEFVYEKICKVGEADREELVKNKELIKTLQDSNTAKATQIDEYKDTVDSLTAEKTALENTVATTQEELEAKEIAIADKEAQINDYLTRIEALETEIDSNEKTIAELEEYNAQAQKDVDNMVVKSQGFDDAYNIIYYEDEIPYSIDFNKSTLVDANFINNLLGKELYVNQIIRYNLYSLSKDSDSVSCQFFDKNFDIAENAPAVIECYVNGELTTDLSVVMNSSDYKVSIDFETNIDENDKVTSATIKFMFDLDVLTLENGGLQSLTITNDTDGSIIDNTEFPNLIFVKESHWVWYNYIEGVEYDRTITLTTYEGQTFTGTLTAGTAGDGFELTLSE